MNLIHAYLRAACGSDETLDKLLGAMRRSLTGEGPSLTVLRGEARSGKSSVCRIWASLFRGEEAGACDLYELGNRFTLSRLETKRAVFLLDDGAISAVAARNRLSVLKKLTGGDAVFVDVPRQHGHQWVFKTHFVLSGNTPSILDEPLRRRATVVELVRCDEGEALGRSVRGGAGLMANEIDGFRADLLSEVESA